MVPTTFFQFPSSIVGYSDRLQDGAYFFRKLWVPERVQAHMENIWFVFLVSSHIIFINIVTKNCQK